MNPNINQRSPGRLLGALAIGTLAIGTLLLLPACVPQPAGTGAPTAAAPSDPIMRAVAAARLGTPVAAASPAYPGPVTVTITSDYISAEGQECRAYTISSGSLTSHLACTDGANWREIPALAPSVNPGLPQ
jgi:hypothetical protein